MFISRRPRRLRANSPLRALVQETRLSPQQLCLPLFVSEGKKINRSHRFIPGLQTVSLDCLPSLIRKIQDQRIGMVLLFGVTSKKDSRGSSALKKENPVVKAIHEIREKFPDTLVATDVALDPYTDHGHDGLFRNGKILNDETVDVLCRMSLLHADAGAHVIAPSDMMDGRIRAIRQALEEKNHKDVCILAYTAKYASCLYGPFRETLQASVRGDKKTYQMNPANRREALRSLELDLKEGADMVMVKPATWYSDIISDFRLRSDAPLAAYQVSGECAMIELGSKNGLFDRNRAILESSTSLFRAGADILVTYFAMDLAALLRETN